MDTCFQAPPENPIPETTNARFTLPFPQDSPFLDNLPMERIRALARNILSLPLLLD